MTKKPKPQYEYANKKGKLFAHILTKWEQSRSSIWIPILPALFLMFRDLHQNKWYSTVLFQPVIHNIRRLKNSRNTDSNKILPV